MAGASKRMGGAMEIKPCSVPSVGRASRSPLVSAAEVLSTCGMRWGGGVFRRVRCSWPNAATRGAQTAVPFLLPALFKLFVHGAAHLGVQCAALHYRTILSTTTPIPTNTNPFLLHLLKPQPHPSCPFAPRNERWAKLQKAVEKMIWLLENCT